MPETEKSRSSNSNILFQDVEVNTKIMSQKMVKMVGRRGIALVFCFSPQTAESFNSKNVHM